MKIFIKKIYLVLFLIFFLLVNTKTFGKNNHYVYTSDNISNYFTGILHVSSADNKKAFNYLKKVKSLKNVHSNFNIEFIRTLILVEKFEEAFSFSKEIWNKDEIFFEVDLLLGLQAFKNKKYQLAKKHFKRLSKVSQYTFLFEDFLGNILLAWVEASDNNKVVSLKFLNEISPRYENIKKIQNAFLQCYFDTAKTEVAFENLINDKSYNLSRYNFFFANYLLSKNKKKEGNEVIRKAKKKHDANLLIKQANKFIEKDNIKKINEIFSCQNSKDAVAEIFYLFANIYSTENNYKLSNFYLKISLFLNNKFLPNKALLAENLFYQKKFEDSKNVFKSIETIGEIYFWYSNLKIAKILSGKEGSEYSTTTLKKKFSLLSDPNYEQYYQLANFYKDNEYYSESIKYYLLALKNIEKNHFLVPNILTKIGISYERLGKFDKAEKNLEDSLKISPDEPHVLNYLAYMWVEQNKNINKAIKMLVRATSLKENDGYIIDSLGWAHFMSKNYIDAEKYLREALEILPSDPVINDHYADTLWMLKKNMQARYYWSHVLNLDNLEKKLKDSVNKKIIFGINKKL